MAPVIYVAALCIVAIVAAVCQRGATHRDR